MAKYGLPYQGSKDKIAEQLIKCFPKSDNFYDLFGGGFSITHCMLNNRYDDYKQFHFNEIRSGICDLIKNAIAGKYNYNIFKPKFIDREEFIKNKEKCAYTKILWSFGNNGKDYLFAEEIESYKKSLHNAVVFNEFDSNAKTILGIDSFFENQSIKERRLFVRRKVFSDNKIKDNNISRGDLQQLEQLERLERLHQLERLERLYFTSTSYENIKIKENSVIYCDIPYKGTSDYGFIFNHKKFFDWANNLKEPVFISEYNIDDNRFKKVFEIDKRALISANGSGDIKKERVYVNKSGFNILLKNKLKK